LILTKEKMKMTTNHENIVFCQTFLPICHKLIISHPNEFVNSY